MLHFHIAPTYNSEGLFMIPHLDNMAGKFEAFKDSNIKGIKISYLNNQAQKDYFNLVKFKIKLSSDKTKNVRIIEDLNQKLQFWETQTGGDMTWVAKFSSETDEVIICVELRAGINQYTQEQIDNFSDRNLWGKIGFTEVMGKKYSMLSQNNLDDAIKHIMSLKIKK